MSNASDKSKGHTMSPVDTLSESSESQVEWQNVKHKKRSQLSPKAVARRRISLDNIPSTSRINRFAELSDKSNESNDKSNDETQNEATQEVIIRPPPIIIPDVNDVNKMLENITTIISDTMFTYKALNDGQMRIMTKPVATYRFLISYLRAKKVQYHTYQLKSERAFRVVIKNLHYSTKIEDIKIQLTKLGHKVRNVTNIKHKFTKQPLSMFFVDLEPDSTNKKIYDIKHINNAMVTLEAPRKTFDIVQCFRCQKYGHTKAYCSRANKCVQCGEEHLTSMCMKDKNSPARCANCLKNHPTSYKGCEIYQDLIRNKQLNYNKIHPTIATNNPSEIATENFPPLKNTPNSQIGSNNNNNNNYRRNYQTYAYTVRANNQENSSTTFEKIELLLNNLLSIYLCN